MVLEGWQKCHSIQYKLLYISLFEKKNGITKIENVYEVVIPTMAPRHFRRYFRMYTDILNSIIWYLELREQFTSLLDKGWVCRHKKVAMTCAYLGTKLAGFHHVMKMLFTFCNIFIKCHEIHSQKKLIIIKSLTFEHCHNSFGVSENTFLKCTDVVMDALIANLQHMMQWPEPSE